MRNVLIFALLANFGSGIAFADVKVVRSIQMDSMMGMGGSAKTMTQWTAADRQREEQKGEGKPSMMERMAGTDKPAITRLDKKVRWTLNAPKKSYQEKPLVVPQQESKQDDSGSDDRTSDGKEEKPTSRISKAEFKVTPLNQKKKIGTFDCEGYSVRTVIETEDLESHERSELKMITLLWNTPETGAVAQLKKEEEAYGRAYLKAIGVSDNAQAAFKALGTTMFAAMAGSGEDELSKALAGMPAEMKKMKGYPISTRVEVYGKDEGDSDAQAAEAENVEIPTDMADALGSFAGAFAKKKMESKKPAATAEGKLMMAMTTVIQSIDTAKISSDVFEIPQGFKKTN